jgi:hypothetical protein
MTDRERKCFITEHYSPLTFEHLLNVEMELGRGERHGERKCFKLHSPRLLNVENFSESSSFEKNNPY